MAGSNSEQGFNRRTGGPLDRKMFRTDKSSFNAFELVDGQPVFFREGGKTRLHYFEGDPADPQPGDFVEEVGGEGLSDADRKGLDSIQKLTEPTIITYFVDSRVSDSQTRTGTSKGDAVKTMKRAQELGALAKQADPNVVIQYEVHRESHLKEEIAWDDNGVAGSESGIKPFGPGNKKPIIDAGVAMTEVGVPISQESTDVHLVTLDFEPHGLWQGDVLMRKARAQGTKLLKFTGYSQTTEGGEQVSFLTVSDGRDGGITPNVPEADIVGSTLVIRPWNWFFSNHEVIGWDNGTKQLKLKGWLTYGSSQSNWSAINESHGWLEGHKSFIGEYEQWAKTDLGNGNWELRIKTATNPATNQNLFISKYKYNVNGTRANLNEHLLFQDIEFRHAGMTALHFDNESNAVGASDANAGGASHLTVTGCKITRFLKQAVRVYNEGQEHQEVHVDKNELAYAGCAEAVYIRNALKASCNYNKAHHIAHDPLVIYGSRTQNTDDSPSQLGNTFEIACSHSLLADCEMIGNDITDVGGNGMVMRVYGGTIFGNTGLRYSLIYNDTAFFYGVNTGDPLKRLDGRRNHKMYIARNVAEDMKVGRYCEPKDGGEELASLIYLDNSSGEAIIIGNYGKRIRGKGVFLNRYNDKDVVSHNFFYDVDKPLQLCIDGSNPIDLTKGQRYANVQRNNYIVRCGSQQVVTDYLNYDYPDAEWSQGITNKNLIVDLVPGTYAAIREQVNTDDNPINLELTREQFVKWYGQGADDTIIDSFPAQDFIPNASVEQTLFSLDFSSDPSDLDKVGAELDKTYNAGQQRVDFTHTGPTANKGNGTDTSWVTVRLNQGSGKIAGTFRRGYTYAFPVGLEGLGSNGSVDLEIKDGNDRINDPNLLHYYDGVRKTYVYLYHHRGADVANPFVQLRSFGYDTPKSFGIYQFEGKELIQDYTLNPNVKIITNRSKVADNFTLPGITAFDEGSIDRQLSQVRLEPNESILLVKDNGKWRGYGKTADGICTEGISAVPTTLHIPSVEYFHNSQKTTQTIALNKTARYLGNGSVNKPDITEITLERGRSFGLKRMEGVYWGYKSDKQYFHNDTNADETVTFDGRVMLPDRTFITEIVIPPGRTFTLLHSYQYRKNLDGQGNEKSTQLGYMEETGFAYPPVRTDGNNLRYRFNVADRRIVWPATGNVTRTIAAKGKTKGAYVNEELTLLDGQTVTFVKGDPKQIISYAGPDNGTAWGAGTYNISARFLGDKTEIVVVNLDSL